MQKIKDFLKTETGKAIETALWQMLNLAIGIFIIHIGEANIVLLFPIVPVLNKLTKFINLKYIKKV